MAELPIISGDDCVRTLERAGYKVARTRGSHVRMRAEGRPPVTVPRHRELDRGTLRAIIAQAAMSTDEFMALWRQR